ncbi:MAG: hypothetical protein HGJ97_06705, partial [Desulfosporosinus sp.]|nr:hypothetical protein [Desulfosporosinus sp.]
KITAALNDPNFINQIDNNEVAISKDDLLIVEMKTTQWQAHDGNIKTENEIVKVLEHKRTPKQLAIPFYEENSNNND